MAIGLGIALLFFLLFAALGGRIYLSWLQARSLSLTEKHLFNKFQNFCYLLRIRKAQIYKSAYEPEALICFHGLLGTEKIIVVGQNLIDNMKTQELDALILYSLKKLKKAQFHQVFIYSLLFLPYSLSLMAFEKYVSSSRANTIMGFLLYPFTCFKSLFLLVAQKTNKHDPVSLAGHIERHFIEAGLNNLANKKSTSLNDLQRREFLRNFCVSNGNISPETKTEPNNDEKQRDVVKEIPLV